MPPINLCDLIVDALYVNYLYLESSYRHVSQIVMIDTEPLAQLDISMIL